MHNSSVKPEHITPECTEHKKEIISSAENINIKFAVKKFKCPITNQNSNYSNRG